MSGGVSLYGRSARGRTTELDSSKVVSTAGVVPTGATTPLSVAAHLAEILSPTAFGAVPDGVLAPDGTASGTDNTAALNTYFAKCRDLGIRWRLPYGNWLCLGQLVIYGEGDPDGYLLLPNTRTLVTDGDIGIKIRLLPNPADVQTIAGSEVRSWGNCVRHSRKIDGLTGRRGQYITVDVAARSSTESDPSRFLIKRRNTTSPFIAMGEGFLVADNVGGLAHSLYADWGNSTWPDVGSGGGYVAQTLRERVQIYGLKIILYKTAATTGCNTVLQVERCNVDIFGATIKNASGIAIDQGHNARAACNVNYYACHVEGLQVVSTNYGFNSSLCASLSYNGCSEVYCRRGIDGHRTKDVAISGCNLPDGFGGHWIVGVSVTQSTLGARESANPQIAQVAGGNIAISDSRICISDAANDIVAIRDDIFELFGKVTIRDCEITIMSGTAAVNIFSSNGPNGGYDTGRTTWMPSLLTIRNNKITVLDGTTRRVVNFVKHLQSGWVRTRPVLDGQGNPTYDGQGNPVVIYMQDIVVTSKWDIAYNPIEYSSGEVNLSNGTPRTQISYAKPEMVVGDGAQCEAADFASFSLTTFAPANPVRTPEDPANPGALVDPTSPRKDVTSIARLRLRLSRIPGAINLLLGPGAYQSIIHDTPQAPTQTRTPPAVGYPTLPDEIVRQTDLSSVISSPTRAAFVMADGSPLMFTNVTGMINYGVWFGGAAGQNLKLQATGGDGNIGIEYVSRGTKGHLFQTASGTMQFEVRNTTSAVNYVRVAGGTSNQPAIVESFGENGAGLLIRSGNGGPVTVQGLVATDGNYGGDVTSATVTIAGATSTVSNAIFNRAKTGANTDITSLFGLQRITAQPQGSEPSSPTEGLTYFDQALHRWRSWDGTRWANLSAGYAFASNANLTVALGTNVVGVRGLTASRTITLPSAAAYPPSESLEIKDESGACSSTILITIQAAGSDTIQGGPSIDLTTAYQSITLRSNGSNLWTYD